jgi:tRNA uridine 5-carboxymethylaminomethyl modification enzyme
MNAEQVEIEIKYKGYNEKQLEQAAQIARLRRMSLEGIDLSKVQGLRIEAREKLAMVNPESIGRRMNISGVSPADISVLLIELAKRRREKEKWSS